MWEQIAAAAAWAVAMILVLLVWRWLDDRRAPTIRLRKGESFVMTNDGGKVIAGVMRPTPKESPEEEVV